MQLQHNYLRSQWELKTIVERSISWHGNALPSSITALIRRENILHQFHYAKKNTGKPQAHTAPTHTEVCTFFPLPYLFWLFLQWLLISTLYVAQPLAIGNRAFQGLIVAV